MRLTSCLLMGALCTVSIGAVAAGASPGPEAAAGAEGLHLNWLDKSVNPARDFFEFANGTWQKDNPIPPSYSRWGTFGILSKQNHEFIRQMLEEVAKNTRAQPGSNEQKIGDFYFSGMDETAINKAGITPLQSEFKRIDDVESPKQLQTEIAHLQMIGVNALFGFGQMQDFKDSSRVIGAAFQGGLGLPDRDYYLKKDAKFVKVRAEYVQHIARMFELLGDSKDNAGRKEIGRASCRERV